MGVTVAILEAASAVAVHNVGWSWSATMGAVQNLILLTLGGGGFGLLVRAIVQLRRIANERAKQEDDRDGARWTELMGYNEKLTTRVEKLELDLREERKRCDEEMLTLRKAHIEEIGAMRREHTAEVKSISDRLEALQRMMIQNQLSTAQALQVPPNAPKAIEAMERVGATLRNTMGGEE